jgi:hypothetical protein
MMLGAMEMQKALKEIGFQDLCMALKGASEKAQNKIFENMSNRAASMLKEDMEYMGPVRLTDVNRARDTIARIIHRLKKESETVNQDAADENTCLHFTRKPEEKNVCLELVKNPEEGLPDPEPPAEQAESIDDLPDFEDDDWLEEKDPFIKKVSDEVVRKMKHRSWDESKRRREKKQEKKLQKNRMKTFPVITVYGHGETIDKIAVNLFFDRQDAYVYCRMVSSIKPEGESFVYARTIAKNTQYFLPNLLPMVFADIVLLDDRSIQKIMREIDSADLARALIGETEEVQEKIFRNMSKRAAGMLQEDMENISPLRKEVIKAAQEKILDIVFRLEDGGEIVICHSDGDLIV